MPGFGQRPPKDVTLIFSLKALGVARLIIQRAEKRGS
jgi:hypothetical protein